MHCNKSNLGELNRLNRDRNVQWNFSWALFAKSSINTCIFTIIIICYLHVLRISRNIKPIWNKKGYTGIQVRIPVYRVCPRNIRNHRYTVHIQFFLSIQTPIFFLFFLFVYYAFQTKLKKWIKKIVVYRLKKLYTGIPRLSSFDENCLMFKL